MKIITSKTLESRRRFIRELGAAGAFFATSGLFAEALTLTPQVTQGPFYPLAKNIPLDKDNDLVQLNDNTAPAAGLVTFGLAMAGMAAGSGSFNQFAPGITVTVAAAGAALVFAAGLGLGSGSSLISVRRHLES